MEIKKTLKIMCMFVVMLVSLIPMSVALSLNSNNPNLIVTFDKLQDVNITIKKRMVDSMESPMDLGPDDQVILTLIKVEGEPGEQEFVQQAAPPQHGHPGHGADQVAGPERHHADEKERQLPFEGLHLHGQEIGDGVAQQEAQRHHHDGEIEG